MSTVASNIFYSEEAEHDLDVLSNFLTRQAGDLTAHDVIRELLDCFEALKDLPYLGHEHPDKLMASRGYRVYSAGRYVGVYLVIEEGVLMTGVYHTKTDWLRVD